MFKGLKNKLEDEAKKLQATVQSTVAQYGESISQQVGQIRTNASDAGSESGASISRRFFGAASGSPSSHSQQADDSPAHANALNYSVGSALMEEVTEGDLLGLDLPQRERRISGGSNHSNESSMSNLFGAVPGMTATTLDVLESDVESTIDEQGSAYVRSASKEQISSVLHKLQGRAANYKDKYRDLVKSYNEVVTENNKCRTVLAQTQDKALQRIEKLRNEKRTLAEKLKEVSEGTANEENERKLAKYEEMLKKCTEEIRRNRAKLTELAQENENLKTHANSATDEAGLSDLASERLISEWKQRVEKVEEEWTERLNKAESDAAITLAQSKADMHAALENKDREVESLRAKCRTLEIQDGQANERWQKKVDDLKEVVTALETEKSDMVEKLSEAKIQGVKAVRDEETAKRAELVSEFEAKEQEMRNEIEKLTADLKTLNENLDKCGGESDSKLDNAELLSLEEKLRDSAAKLESAEKENENLRTLMDERESEVKKLKLDLKSLEEQVKEGQDTSATENKEKESELQADIRHLEEKLLQSDERRRKEVSEVQETLERQSAHHKEEVAMLIKEHEDIINSAREQAEIERRQLEAKLEKSHMTSEALRTQLESLESRVEELQKETDLSNTSSEQQIASLETELQALRTKCSEFEGKYEIAAKQLTDAQSELDLVRNESTVLAEELETVRNQVDDHDRSASDAQKELSEEVEELKRMLEERNEAVRKMESEREALEIELAQSRELSAVHEHLRGELQAAQKARDDVELHVEELQKRAEQAEKQLQEDRESLATERAEMERRLTEMTESFQSAQSNSLIDVEETVERGNVATVSASHESQSHPPDLIPTNPTIPTGSEPSEQAEISVPSNVESSSITEKASFSDRVIEELESKLKVMESDLEQRATEHGEIVKQKETIEEELKSIRTELSEVLNGEGVTQLKQKLAQVVQVENLLSEASFRIEKMEAERATIVQKADKYEREVQELTEKISHLEGDIELAQNTSIQEGEARAEAVEEANRQRERLEKELEELRKQTEAEHSELRETIDGSLVQNESLKAVLEELKKEKETLAAERDSLKEAHSVAVRELDSARGVLSMFGEAEERVKELTVKLEELQQEKTESENGLRAEISTLHAQLAETSREVEQNTSETQRSANEQASRSVAAKEKIRELEELGDKMRTEFIQKEKILSELRAEVDVARKEAKEARDHRAEAEILNSGLKENLAQALSDLSNKDEELQKVEERLKSVLHEKDDELKAQKMMREEALTSIASLKAELSAVEKKMKELESADGESKKLRKEMDSLTEEYASYRQEKEKEQEAAISEMKRKAEAKLGKIKKELEKEVNASKAEMLLEMDKLRASVSDRDKQLDEIKVEKAKLEQQLIGETETKKELSDERTRCHQLISQVSDLERRISELTIDAETSEREREELRENRHKKEEEIEQLREKIKSLEDANEDGFRKAAAKQDLDGKKVVRELQREVKQLYQELTEKTSALDEANQKIKSFESSTQNGGTGSESGWSGVKENVVVKKKNASLEAEDDGDNLMAREEINSLKKRLADSHREIDQLRANLSRASPRPQQSNSHYHDHELSFAEPTEAEYLRNVLFRYMSERETLGKESVTLARVIGTVARFSKDQLTSVVSKEEARVVGWGVQQALQGAVHGGRAH